jgi:hypothetical protein
VVFRCFHGGDVTRGSEYGILRYGDRRRGKGIFDLCSRVVLVSTTRGG